MGRRHLEHLASAGASRLVVDRDGDTILDCYVYDLIGVLLGKDDGLTGYCIVDLWHPSGGYVKLHIVHLGEVDNLYAVRVRQLAD